MKRLTLLCCLLFVATTELLPQDSKLTPELRYLLDKKEVGTAIVLSLILPGGGHFYAENEGLAFMFVVGEVGSVVWYLSNRKTQGEIERDWRGTIVNQPETSYTPLYVLAVLRLLDILLAPLSVDEYNTDLMKRLKISPSLSGIGIRLSFQL